MSKDTVLVTGGAGYIGSYTCKILYHHGFTPISIDNLSRGHKEFVKWGPLVVGDIRDNLVLEKVFKKYQPMAVIHFAALAYVGESAVDPGRYYHNNVLGTINLLESMRRFGCKLIVFSSSCATYGIPDKIPINEKSDQSPINPYGQSKLIIEKILSDYSNAYAFNSVSLRYFNAAGAGEDKSIGEKHSPETHIIPLAIFTAMGKRDVFEIFGTDYPTKDGTAIRDYIHVVDLARAHLNALDFIIKNSGNFAFNLGTGIGVSVKEIIDLVSQLSGLKLPYKCVQPRIGDPPVLIAENKNAKKFLEWDPVNSQIDNIIKTAWDYHATQIK